MADSAFLEEQGFPLQCTYVRLTQEQDTDTGFYRWRITSRCEHLPNQRIRGIYTCDDHARPGEESNGATLQIGRW
jgi:hypothetical protein